MSNEDLQAEPERLRAENESLKKKRNSAVSMKVSEKGGLSVFRHAIQFLSGRREKGSPSPFCANVVAHLSCRFV